jgi:fumarate reductase subunit D
MSKSSKKKTWSLEDISKLAFIIPALLLMLCTSFANVLANLKASGEVVFVEQPMLAVFIALLAPLGSITMKFIGDIFTSDRAKRRYTTWLYLMTAIVFVLWMVAFAQQFHGVTAGMDWGEMLEGDRSKGSALVLLQLLAEVLVAASLAQAAQTIFSKCYITIPKKNPTYIALEQRRDEHLVEHRKLRDERNDTHARLVELRAKRQAAINDYLAEYAALVARYQAANDF